MEKSERGKARLSNQEDEKKREREREKKKKKINRETRERRKERERDGAAPTAILGYPLIPPPTSNRRRN